MTRPARPPAEYYAVALLVYLLTRVGLFTFTVAGEFALYQDYGDAARRDGLAHLYRSRDVEYPHLAVLFGSVAGVVTDALPDGLPRLVGWRANKFGQPYIDRTRDERARGDRFEVGLGLVLWAVDLACLGLVYLIARRAYPADGPRERAGRLIGYTIATAMIGPILFDRQDLVVGLFALLAVWGLAAGRPRVGYAVLVVGTAYKLVPVLLLPVWVLAAAAARAGPGATPVRYAKAVVWEAVIGGVMLALWPIGVGLFGGGLDRGFLFLTFHADRGLQLEAPLAPLALALDPAAEVGHGYGSYNLRSGLADRLAGATKVLMPLAVLAAVGLSARGFWRVAAAPGSAGVPPAPDAGGTPAVHGGIVPHVVAASLLVWLGFILANKVGSPQYLLWVGPLLPLLPLRSWAERAWALLLLVEMALVTAVFPIAYEWVVGDPVHNDPATWAGPSPACRVLLAAKSVTLLVAVGWLAVQVWRSPHVPPSPETSP